jgi:hypothetical protein
VFTTTLIVIQAVLRVAGCQVSAARAALTVTVVTALACRHCIGLEAVVARRRLRIGIVRLITLTLAGYVRDAIFIPLLTRGGKYRRAMVVKAKTL